MFGDPKYNKNHYNIVKIEDVCWKVTDGDHNTPIRENSRVFYYYQLEM